MIKIKLSPIISGIYLCNHDQLKSSRYNLDDISLPLGMSRTYNIFKITKDFENFDHLEYTIDPDCKNLENIKYVIMIYGMTEYNSYDEEHRIHFVIHYVEPPDDLYDDDSDHLKSRISVEYIQYFDNEDIEILKNINITISKLVHEILFHREFQPKTLNKSNFFRHEKRRY